MTKRIALISEHASPLGTFGGVDSGGQNVYVGQLAKQLASLGYQVDVFTRRDRPDLPTMVDWQHGVRVIHVPAGPATEMPKEALFPFMGEFRDFVLEFCRSRLGQQANYDLIHANFWMSGFVAAEIKQAIAIPFVVTFHALGRVRRFYQGDADQFPDERFLVEERVIREADRIIAECPQDREDLLNLYGADPQRIQIIPCGVDPTEFWPIHKIHARLTLGLPLNEPLILQLGRMVPRKGVENVIQAFAQLLKRQTILEHDNGISNGMSNGLSNGLSSGMSNGISNGLSSGMSNSLSNGLSNGSSNGLSNGLSNSVSNSLSNGLADGLASGISNGMSDGMSNGLSNGLSNSLSNGSSNGFSTNPSLPRLLIVGGESDTPDPDRTPEIGRLMAIAQDLGIASRITFVDRKGRDILKYYYSAADIFVTTPWYEPFGITPLEAMACGTPVIGAAVGGVKFTVKHGETGFLVPPREPDLLADKMQYLLENPQIARLFGQQAIRRCQEHFTWQRVATAVAALYEEVLTDLIPTPSVEAEQLAILDRGFESMMQALQQSHKVLRPAIQAAARAIGNSFLRGGKLLICGNGGSAAEAQHLAAELMGRFCCPYRAGLPAIALTADTAFLTAWANDIGYDEIFARQVKTLAQPADLLLGISTSGNSQNLITAFEAARQMNLTTLALLGGDGGQLRNLADLPIVIPTLETQRIQEIQLLIIHLLCELLEEQLRTPNGTTIQWDEQKWEDRSTKGRSQQFLIAGKL